MSIILPRLFPRSRPDRVSAPSFGVRRLDAAWGFLFLVFGRVAGVGARFANHRGFVQSGPCPGHPAEPPRQKSTWHLRPAMWAWLLPRVGWSSIAWM